MHQDYSLPSRPAGAIPQHVRSQARGDFDDALFAAAQFQVSAGFIGEMHHPARVGTFGEEAPHPRNYGTFARVLGRYVRERRVLTLEDGVRRMTSLPAGRLKLMDRGLLRPGMKADIAVFDPAAIADKATFAEPHHYAVGVLQEFVNGAPVLRDGKMTGQRPGRVLYGPAH